MSAFTAVVPACGHVVRFVAEADQVRSARELVAALLRKWELDDLIDDAKLITSELVTNAMNATPGRTVMLVMAREPYHVFLGVWDESDLLPVMGNSDPMSESGRGLCIAATLADQHGAALMDGAKGGKIVWVRMKG